LKILEVQDPRWCWRVRRNKKERTCVAKTRIIQIADAAGMVIMGANTLNRPDSYHDHEQNNKDYSRLLRETRNKTVYENEWPCIKRSKLDSGVKDCHLESRLSMNPQVLFFAMYLDQLLLESCLVSS
jgi:hypothetical protein